MKREIKFRAWIPGEGTMIQHREVIERAHLQFNDELGASDIVMQYTGLKDQKGIEIFEGDVYTHNNRNFVILFNKVQLSLLAHQCNQQSNWRSLEDLARFSKYVKVIGNIYKNPELLPYESI